MQPSRRIAAKQSVESRFSPDWPAVRTAPPTPSAETLIALGLTLLLLLTVASSARASTYTVTNLNDNGPGSLRQAVADANANPGADTIVFPPGLAGTITLTSGEIAVTEELTINGPGAGTLIIDGDHAGRIFNVIGVPTVNHFVPANFGLSSLSLVNGTAPDNAGGAVNSVGGAQGNVVTATSCSFTGNSSGAGGAICGWFVVTTNCTFSGNHASGTGGALDAGISVTATNCSFSRNSAAFYGGGIFTDYSLTATNCVLWENASLTGSQLAGFRTKVMATPMTVSHCDLQGGLAAIFVPGGILTDGGGNFDADPRFVDAAAGDLHLQPGSPCIDAGDSAAPGLVGITTDLDGNPRFVGPAVDIGTFEFHGAAPTLVAVDDSATVVGFRLLTIPVLVNDTAPAGTAISITAVSRAAHGAVSLGPNGTVRYRPLPGFTGTDHFTYTIGDGHGHTATASVTVTVTVTVTGA